MRRLTLFKPPSSFTTRLDELKENLELRRARAELLLQVELGFALMERLELDDEPVTSVWSILSGMPLRHPRLQNLDEMERRAIANARQIIPFSARFSWLGALRSYMQIPQHWRNYDFESQNFDSQIINAAKQLRNPIHQNLYETCLSETLDFSRRDIRQVEAGITYQFEAKTEEETVTLQVEFTQERLDTARSQPIHWFIAPSPQAPLSLRITDLESDALYIDEREQVLAERYGWDDTAKGNWMSRFCKISFHKVQADGTVIQEEDQTLELDGFSHIAGMVASGKTTFMELLAVHMLRHYPDRRITLAVGDVQSAIRMANQINWWFCDDPENDTPVAVPLLGRSKRNAHLQSFSASKDYQNHWQRGQPHWGDRWLGTACPLQGLLRASDITQRLNGKPLKPGTEPCHSLKKVPSNDREQRRRNPGASHVCPFFATCPSQQVYRDMTSARVWITTPGAMAMASLPRHLESRPIKVGELVYEQSNIVVFDEADTSIQWFDNVYAEEVTLTNSNNGVFDEVSVETEEYMRTNRVPPSLMQRWTGAERDVQKAVTAVLTLLDEQSGHKLLQDWTARGYFTPNTLLFKFARRLAGLEEFDPSDISDEESRANTKFVQPIVSCFDALLDDDPLLRGSRSNPQVERLASLVQQINSTGESATDESIHRACKVWITDFFPETEERLAQLRTKLEQRNTNLQQSGKKKRRRSSQEEESDLVDTIETLAYRLQFALTIALLDRHTRIVFYEWHNRPPTIDDEPPRRRMPAAMLDVLPLPPTGRQFGTYYSRQNGSDTKTDNSSSKALSLFAYTNIGRCYVLNFHRLLTDFDGRRGPNVIALSGTSYLPHSTRFHIGEPQGVLMPESEASKAIAKSHFKFLPQYDRPNEPIRISGKPERQKMGLFKDMVRSLVGNHGTGDLGQELRELKLLGESDFEHWYDRDRILLLVNSYNQARWVADEIYNYWSSVRESVYYLTLDNIESAENDVKNEPRIVRVAGAMPLNRADIETFGQTGGKILVAPMNAIGRGFNILNANGNAAFGAVYFLTRPYPHPHDTQAIAQEMNRHALDWVDDPNFIAWQEDSVTQRAEAVRQLAGRYWRSIEQRSYYKTLRDNEELHAFPRLDLAATTAGLVTQAVGRLLRGGVPFHAYFVDAAWAPKSANREADKLDTEKTSLLVAIILIISEYASVTGKVGHALYKPLADALERTEDLNW